MNKLGKRTALEDSMRVQSVQKVVRQSFAAAAIDPQYVHVSVARTITAQHSFTPSIAAAPFALGANAQGQLVTGLYADQLNRSVIAGAGLTGGGLLTVDRTLAVGAGAGLTVNADDVALTTPGTLSVSSVNAAAGSHTHAITSSSNPGAAASLLATTAAGLLTLQELATTRVSSSLIPELTDTYDIGTSLLLWRKGYLSELDALLFAQQTISLVGGWFIIGYNEGCIAADVAAANTSVDFGQAMTVGHFVEFRAALKVEYMQVGTLVSGTRYNVTRNLDGSGANDWPSGTPYLVLGTTGTGRIELNAYDTPRISMVTQGATYNAQTELLRIGDLNANWGYATATYGLALGEYASGKSNITIDPTNGLRLRSYTTTILQIKNSDGLGYIVGPLYLDTSGGIYQGTGTFASPTAGLKIYNSSGAGHLTLYDASNPILDMSSAGLDIPAPTAYANNTAYKFSESGSTIGGLYAEAPGSAHTMYLELPLVAAHNNQISIRAYTPSTYRAAVSLYADSGSATNVTSLGVRADTDGDAGVFVTGSGLVVGDTISGHIPEGDINTSGDIRITGGLYVGTTGTDPSPGTIATDYQEILSGDAYYGYAGAHLLQPRYDGAHTVTVHVYNYCLQPVLTGSAVITDAVVFRFNAAPGTHKAVDSASTKASPGTVNAWIKMLIDGVMHYIPAYTSKTS